MKHLVNFSLLLAFLILVASAFSRFFQPFSLITTRIHIVFGTLLVILVALHLSSRLGYFKRMLRPSKRSAAPGFQPTPLALVLLSVGISGYLLVAAVANWWPVPQIIGLGYESRNRAVIFRPEQGTAVKPLQPLPSQMKRTVQGAAGIYLEIEWGPAFDPEVEFGGPFSGAGPQIAIWAESSNGALIETFFVSEDSAFAESFSWGGNDRRRVDILPIWRHQYTLVSGVKPDGGVDTWSGATPEHSFSIQNYLVEDPNGFYLSLEMNVPGDENAFFHARQDETAEGYSREGIGQPSIYYSVFIDPSEQRRYYLMDFVGHGGSSSQQSGNVYYDASQLTTARNLIEKVLVRIDRPNRDEG